MGRGFARKHEPERSWDEGIGNAFSYPLSFFECEIDLRPGGIFRALMRGPEGQEKGGAGCFLEVVENERLTWTDALGPDFSPQAAGALNFTAIITFEKRGTGARCLVQALYRDASGKRIHEEMGFVGGWGKALDQLVAHCKSLSENADA